MGLIYLDTCLVIYAVEEHPTFGPVARDAMRGREDLAVSPLVKLECLVKPLADADLEVRRAFESAFSQLELLPIPEVVFLDAAELRARFKLKTPDALHLACAQHHRCEALWTNDDRLAQPSRGLARNILKT